jgi:hypothetical protein
MATRFYLPYDAVYSASVSPAFAAFGSTTGAVRRRLLAGKVGDPIATTLVGTGILPNTAGTSAAGANVLLAQFVSDPLAAQTISGTVACQIMMRETGATQNIDAARVALSVVSNDGQTVRGTLLALGEYGTLLELTPTSTHRNVTVITAGQALSSVSALEGDRLVFGLGAVSTTGGTGTPTVRAKFGDAAADLPVDNVQTTDGAGWLELSQSVEFQRSPGVRRARRPFRPGMRGR